MNQIPEWMRQLADTGRQEQTRTASAHATNKNSTESLWSENRIQREALTGLIRTAHNKSSESLIKSTAFTDLSYRLRGTPYKITAHKFQNDRLIVTAHLSSPDRKKEAYAHFVYVWDKSKNVECLDKFSSNQVLYPTTKRGVRHALDTSSHTNSQPKIVTRATLVTQLRQAQLDPDKMIAAMIANKELVQLSSREYTYTTLPSVLAAIPTEGAPSISSTPNEDAVDREKEEHTSEDSTTEETENKLEPPKPPEGPKGVTSSSRLSQLFASLGDQNVSQ